MYETVNKNSSDYVRSGGGRQNIDTSTMDVLQYLCFSINFIDSLLKSLEDNYVRSWKAECDKMK